MLPQLYKPNTSLRQTEAAGPDGAHLRERELTVVDTGWGCMWTVVLRFTTGQETIGKKHKINKKNCEAFSPLSLSLSSS